MEHCDVFDVCIEKLELLLGVSNVSSSIKRQKMGCVFIGAAKNNNVAPPAL